MRGSFYKTCARGTESKRARPLKELCHRFRRTYSASARSVRKCRSRQVNSNALSSVASASLWHTSPRGQRPQAVVAPPQCQKLGFAQSAWILWVHFHFQLVATIRRACHRRSKYGEAFQKARATDRWLIIGWGPVGTSSKTIRSSPSGSHRSIRCFGLLLPHGKWGSLAHCTPKSAKCNGSKVLDRQQTCMRLTNKLAFKQLTQNIIFAVLVEADLLFTSRFHLRYKLL